MTLPIGTRIRITHPAFTTDPEGVYEITRFDHNRCEGTKVGPDDKLMEANHVGVKVIGWKPGPLGLSPVYDEEPAVHFSYCALDIEQLLSSGMASVAEEGTR